VLPYWGTKPTTAGLLDVSAETERRPKISGKLSKLFVGVDRRIGIEGKSRVLPLSLADGPPGTIYRRSGGGIQSGQPQNM